MRLANKVALVIGAGQTDGDTIGNGRATALLFAQEGAKVFAVDKRLASAEETCAQIAAQGGTACACGADITREDDCAALVAKCLDVYGRIDVLHNNVGIMSGDAESVDLAEEVWDSIMNTNLKGMFLTIKHVLPQMRAQNGGSIVNVSSTGALSSGGPHVAYNVSKSAVNALTRQLVLENAPYNVRINAIMPGLMDTPMAIEEISRTSAIDKRELRRSRDALVPLGRKMGTGWDVAYAALFAASDESRFMTGAVIPLDGGQSLEGGEWQ